MFLCWGKVAHTTALTSNLSLICFSGKFISISAAGKRSPRYFQRMGIFSSADRNLVILFCWYAAGYPYLLIYSWLVILICWYAAGYPYLLISSLLDAQQPIICLLANLTSGLGICCVAFPLSRSKLLFLKSDHERYCCSLKKRHRERIALITLYIRAIVSKLNKKGKSS